MPPQENRQLIIDWQNWLNQVYPPGPWVAIEGFTSTITTIPTTSDTVTFNVNSGYVMKSFINTANGEIKSFDARRFYA